MKSSYFPDDREKFHASSTALYKADIMGSPATSFPISKLVLWDRTPKGKWEELSPFKAVPLLAIHRAWCHALVSPAQAGSDASTHVRCRLVPRRAVRGFSTPSAGDGVHALAVEAVDRVGAEAASSREATHSPRDSLCVPIDYHGQPPHALATPFETEATSALMAGLTKSIQACRHLSMKSFVRIRGVAVSRPPTVDCGVRKVGATLRLELIAPSASFCAKPIQDLPILKTPLSVQVLQMRKSNLNVERGESLFSSRTTGYLTLSKVRQAVLLLETDPDASIIPLVGAWVYVDCPAPSLESASSLCENTMVWIACCRYLFSSLIQERVWVARNTFLLMVVYLNQIKFYEVSASSSTIADRPSFSCLDFTADLSAPADSTLSSSEEDYVIACRFRPMSNPSLIQAFRSSAKNAELSGGGADDDEKKNSQAVGAVDPRLLQCAEDTPMPRSLGAMPPPSPPARYPNRGYEDKNETLHEDETQRAEIQQVVKLKLGSDRAPDLQATSAGGETANQRTIQKQAAELEELRQQILELRELLSSQASAAIKPAVSSTSKKGKKKANRVKESKDLAEQLESKNVDISRDTPKKNNPIFSDLHEYLKVARQQERIEKNDINPNAVDQHIRTSEEKSLCQISDVTAEDFPSLSERVTLMEPPSMPQFDFLMQKKGVGQRDCRRNTRGDNSVVSGHSLGAGVNIVDSLKSPYVPPIMMVPEPQQYYAEESTAQSEYSAHHDSASRYFDGPNETESLMAIEFKYMR